MKELFTVDERATFNRFTLLLKRTLPDELARGGPRFAARITEGIEGAMKRLSQGAVLRGAPVEGAAIKFLNSVWNERRVNAVLNGEVGQSNLLANILRPAAIGTAVED